jgi:hypothetical protein
LKFKNLNLSAVEQAIVKKYGEAAVQNPNADWTPEKEKEYLKQRQELERQRQAHDKQNEKVEVDGVLMPKKLLNRESRRTCPVCSEYSFSQADDIYMTKFDCCQKCYIQWIENREERWATGWRPNNEKANGKEIEVD